MENKIPASACAGAGIFLLQKKNVQQVIVFKNARF
jgi:hypothetical protein